MEGLTEDRREELRQEAGPHGVGLAASLADKAHAVVEGFPASTAEARSAICLLMADAMIGKAAQESD